MGSPSGEQGFRRLERLGAGGGGEVWLAAAPDGSRVVLKVPLPGDPESARALAGEFERAATLDHPGIARALDLVAGPGGTPCCIVFEAADGEPSGTASRTASPKTILDWAAGLAETLDYLHGTGLVHGDIKPENVLIDARGVPRLIDFGLSRRPGLARGGTARTVAPEVLRGRGGDERADLFSLGATLHLWLLRRAPYGDSLAQRLRSLDARIAPPTVDGLPGPVGALLASLLAPHPEDRPGDARELSAALAKVGARLPDPALADPSARARTLSLVGRDAAIARLAAAWDGGPGGPATIAVCGPRGSGRTRLLELAARRARRNGRFVVQARPDDPRPPGTVVLDALADRGLAPRPSGRVPLAVALRATADLEMQATILVDDAERLDRREREVLSGLAEKLEGARDLAVVIATSDDAPPPGWAHVALPPLDDAGVARILREMLPGPPPPEGLARRLRVETGGLPGRVTGMLLDAVRQGVVGIDARGWHVAPLADHELSRLRSSSDAPDRIPDELGADDRRVLEALVAAGAPESVPRIVSVTRLPAQAVTGAARRLVALGVARRADEGRVAATSGVTDAAATRDAHAAWLDRVAAERPAPASRARIAHLGRLARHAAGCGSAALSARLALRLVRTATARGPIDAATAALAAIEAALPGGTEPRGRSQLARAELLLATGRPADAAPWFERAIRRLDEEGARREARLARARLVRAWIDAGEADAARALLDAADREALAPAERAPFALERGVVSAVEGDFAAALESFARAVSLSAPDSRERTRAHAAHGRALLLANRPAEARRELALARAHRSSDEAIAVVLDFAELQAAAMAGDHHTVLETAPRLATALLARGDLAGLGRAESFMSDAARALGDLDAALTHAEASLRWQRLTGSAAAVAAARARCARVRFARGDVDGARRMLRHLERLDTGTPADLAARVMRARLACLAGDASGAEPLARVALGAARAHGAPGRIAEALTVLGEARLAAGRPAAAARTLERALESARTSGDPEECEPLALALLAEAVVSPVTEAEGSPAASLGAPPEAVPVAPPHAEAAAPDPAARSLLLARRAREIAGRAARFDALTRAIAAEAAALERLGRRDAASDLRRWNVSRLEEAAARLGTRRARREFLSRPDRVRITGQTGGVDARRLDAVHDIAAAMTEQREPHRVLGLLLDEALRLLGAERGAIVLARGGGELDVSLARGIEPETAAGALTLSRTILDRASTGESILAIDPTADSRFSSVESVRMFAIAAVMCVPLHHRGAPVGAVYVDSRDPDHRFDEADLHFLRTLAHHAAIALANARAFDALRNENERLRADLGRGDRFGALVGRSRAMTRLYRQIESIAPQRSPAIVVGESGTGKELVARTLHRLGATPEGPFVAVNCAAIPDGTLFTELFGHQEGSFTGAVTTHDGLISRASGGTLLLDEIGEMSAAMQSALLGVLEDGRYRPIGDTEERVARIRFVVTSKQPLEDLVRSGRLRHDFLQRLGKLTLEVPPLRERRDDFPLLARHLLRELEPDRRRDVSAALLDRFAAAEWPGNVRELRNALERLLLHTDGEVLDIVHFDELHGADSAPPARVGAGGMKRVEEETIRDAIRYTEGNLARAARILRLGRATVYRKVREYGIDVNEFRAPPPSVSS